MQNDSLSVGGFSNVKDDKQCAQSVFKSHLYSINDAKNNNNLNECRTLSSYCTIVSTAISALMGVCVVFRVFCTFN